ncbi:hypothetical protein NHU_00645 [Rhodovulum sulfidophilum]|uniref:REase AHJR-like domain-containing protein n=1 Tax=Rhodovulum sulfidophilum TaxID=35806 RepID=A0A0D6AZE4_RHOSU|nr:hypothetical protein NHU_00645 [Rhodovulum sulfidophilum]
MSEAEETERATLEKMSKIWVGQGFKVFIQPSGKLLPGFLQRYRPDALLIKDDDKVLVEVVRKGQRNAEERVRRLKELMVNQNEWRLEVVYSGENVVSVRRVAANKILESLRSAEDLLTKEPRASLLLFWASLEATVRNLFPNQTSRPQSPGRIIELLAGSGEITPSEAQSLRDLMMLRNRVIHGELNAVVKPSEVKPMLQLVRQLLKSMLE